MGAATVGLVTRSVLVTGGAGFIGSHLCEALHAKGFAVTAFDDLSTGDLSNLASLRSAAGFRFVEGSVLDRSMVNGLVSEADCVVHLAAAVGVQLVLAKPLDSFLVNIDGTHSVLEAVERHDRRLIVASTSEVYGKNTDVPLGETSDRILGPLEVTRWWYSISKGVDEILALGYHHERGVATTVARFFNTVGPRQVGRYGMVIPRFVGQAQRGEPLTVYGTGQQTRTFCHVLDTVSALELLLEEDRAVGQAFNIGGMEETTIEELALQVLDVTQSSSSMTFVPYEDAYPAGFEDTERRVPDTSKLAALVGWKPQHTLRTILKDVAFDLEANQLPMTTDLN